MYTPPMFKPDRAASLAFAQARGFGTFCAWDGNKPMASLLPFYLEYADDGTARAMFHLARHNPLLRLADGTSSWLLAVSGADAYVSADWYVSPDQVPTWLYQAVHLTGKPDGLHRGAAHAGLGQHAAYRLHHRFPPVLGALLRPLRMRHLDVFVERGVPRADPAALIHQKRARTAGANVDA